MQQVITASQVLIGPAGQRIRDGGVLVDGETIIAVGSRHHLDDLADADTRYRHYDGTLMPGLINSHVHLSFDTTPEFLQTVRDADDETLLRGMAERARQALSAGVTTLRDLGCRRGIAIRLRDAITRGELFGPRILASAAPLTIPQGHCHFLGGEVSGEAGIRRQVQHNAELGADVIKVMASGGQITPGSPPMWQSQFSSLELAIVVDEASRYGLPVAAHAHGTDAIAAATDAGVTTVEHCSWQGPHGPDRRDDVARKMAAKGIYASSGLSRNWRSLMEKLGPDKTEAMYGKLRWLADQGVSIVIGSDAGLARSVFDDFVGTMELFEHLGFSNTQVLDMATTTSATALGIADRAGRLAPGYAADLIAVDGDPLQKIADLRRLRLVLTRGHEVPAPADT